MQKNYWLSQRLDGIRAEAKKKYIVQPSGSAVQATYNLVGAGLTETVSHLGDITHSNPTNSGEFLQSLSSNLRYASFLGTEKPANPDKKNFRKIALTLLKTQGFGLSRDGNTIVASKGKVSFSITLSDLDLGRVEYFKSTGFRKKAAIIPSTGFVKGLAKEAFDTVVRIKPKDVSKAISGFVHSLWFDYAVDKNIYLASMLYHELRESYLPKLQEDFNIKEIKYFSSDSRDRRLSKFITKLTEALDSGKRVKNVVGSVKEVYSELSTRDVCDRVILLGELIGVEDNKLEKIGEHLRRETELDFEFA
jgi:hypothetical protein